MTGKSYVISYYPLTTDYLSRLIEVTAAPVHTIVLTNISATGYFDIPRALLRIEADALYLPAIDETYRSLHPMLGSLSAFVRARAYFVVEPDFTIRPLRRREVVSGLIAIVRGLVMGLTTIVPTALRARWLSRAPRIRCRAVDSKRILYMKTDLWLGLRAGGSVAHTGGVIGALIKRNYRVDFMSAESSDFLPQGDALVPHRIRPPYPYVAPREFNHFRHNANFIRAALDLAVDDGDFGFVYQRLSGGNYAGTVVSRRTGLPLILEYNGSEVWLARNWGRPLFFESLAAKTESASLRHAHLIVTVSDALRSRLIAGGIEPWRVVAHPNGVDTALFDPDRFSAGDIAAARAQWSIPEHAVVAAFVGTFGAWHGAEVLAEALRNLARDFPDWLERTPLHIVFIGDGGRRQSVERILSANALDSYWTITGLVEQHEAPQLMAAADILVAPTVPNPDGSPFFGSPTKLFEYLSMARPVIASDLDQIGEVMAGSPPIAGLPDGAADPGDAACGLLVAPDNADELAAALRFAADNAAWREAVGRNARRRALDRYGWEHHVDAILSGLGSVVAREAHGARIRVLINALHSKSGGGITYLANVLPLFDDDAELDVHLCVHEDQRELVPAGLKNVTVHYLSFGPGFWRLQFWEQVAVPRLSRRIGADVIFSPANFAPLVSRNSVILLRNAPSVAMVENRPVRIAYWGLVMLGTALSLMVCRRAIAVSGYARRTFSRGLLHGFRRRISIIPHGVSEMFSPAATPDRREEFLLVVSDLYVQKNLGNLLRAMVRLRGKHPGITLKIAGRAVDENYYADLRKIVRDEGLEDTVSFLGHVAPEQLVDLYRRCAVFVFPSAVETFGNPLVEAMACGAPVASSDSAAMPEVLGDAASYFNFRDVDGITATLDRLLCDAGLRRRLGENAIRRARAFSWRNTADRTVEVIKQAAAP